MKVYYKGNLIKKINLEKNEIGELVYSNGKIFYICNNNSPESLKNFFRYNHEFLTKVSYNIKASEILHLFNIKTHSNQIIFEIVKDINGNLFGKEIITNNLFPILNKDNFNLNINFKIQEQKIFIDEYHMNLSYQNIEKIGDFLLDIPNNPNSIEPANKNEVMDYLNQYKKGFRHEHKLNKFREKMNILSNQTIYNQENIIKEKENIPKLQPSKETLIMENIEFLLLKLKNENLDSYLILNKEYQDILNQNEILTTKPLILQTLISLEAKIETCFFNTKRNIISLLEYIKNLIYDYLNDKEINITLEELFKLNDLFIKQKDNYSLINQRIFQRNISILYFFKLYELKDNLNIEQLNNTYIVDNLKTIVMVIYTLNEENILKYNYYLDLNNILLDNVISLIKNISFINKDTDKIKKILF